VKTLWLIVLSAVCLFWSCSDKSKDLFYVDIVNPLDGGVGIKMVAISGGTFQMGSKLRPPFYTVLNIVTGELDTIYNRERPVHPVTLDPFKISTTEITQEQYKTVMGVNPANFQAGEYNLPVEKVSWEEAVTFCNKLSNLTGLDPCYNLETWECDFTRNGFRLPTEAEWEYAYRAGLNLEYIIGNDTRNLDRAAWSVSNSSLVTHPIATKDPNNAGLYDMAGNVWEWCYDYFGYYHCNSEVNPIGPSMGYYRVQRGGSWASTADDCRAAARKTGDPKLGSTTAGFRVARR
jgi:formylglycine-generating enzyme required for sulfatase activity